jgi:hypothetical protein
MGFSKENMQNNRVINPDKDKKREQVVKILLPLTFNV